MNEQPHESEMKTGLMEPVESATTAPVESEVKLAAEAHPSLREQCEARQKELRAAVDRLDDDGSRTRRDIEAALGALDELLTGNLDHIPPVVAAQMSKWLESSKYLGVKETREETRERAAPSPEPTLLTNFD
jgi:hypothetical protein